MGASRWLYFTPYETKPATALRRLRQRVYTTGTYRKPTTVPERLAQLGPIPKPSQIHRQTAEQLRMAIEAGASKSEALLSAIAHVERLAEEAENREPQYLRFMQALQNGTLESLPEVQEWNTLARDAFGPPVQPIPKKRPRKSDSIAGKIVTVLIQAGETGTHSILDIVRVGKRPAHATAFPLEPSVVRNTFGTTEPARTQVENDELTFAEELHWQAAYFAVFQEGNPIEWTFVGSSGD